MLWWTDDLETGIETIDNQHKTIFNKANEIFDLGKDTEVDKLKEIISFLMSYTNSHFLEEEQLMIDNQYNEFLEHKESHNLFVEEIYKIYLRVENGKIDEDLFNDLKALIIEWLARHINTKDKNFVRFLSQTL